MIFTDRQCNQPAGNVGKTELGDGVCDRVIMEEEIWHFHRVDMFALSHLLVPLINTRLCCRKPYIALQLQGAKHSVVAQCHMLVGAISEVFTIIIAVIIPFVLSSLSRLRSTSTPTLSFHLRSIIRSARCKTKRHERRFLGALQDMHSKTPW